MNDTLHNTAEFLCIQLTIEGGKIRVASTGFTGSLFGTVIFLGAVFQGHGLCYTLKKIKKPSLLSSSENKSSDNVPLTFDCASAQSVVPVYRGV